MAKRKKSRTPAPPKRSARPASAAGRSVDGKGRQVQAPQVRTGKRRTQADQERRARMMLYGLALSGILGLVIALVVVFAFRGGGGGTSNAHDDGPNVDFAKLVGILKDPAPWPANTRDLGSRLGPIGLHPLKAEGQGLHIHEHLDIFINGRHVIPPRYIGIKLADHGTKAEFIAEIHTHTASTDGQTGPPGAPTGVIHLETPYAHTYSLGQFFGVWGVFLSRQCIGGYCAKPGVPLRFYVEGKLFLGNPVRLTLEERQEIAIVYGKPPAHIPSTYTWDGL